MNVEIYQSGPRPGYQCSVCGGWFMGGHFCVGKRPTSAREAYEVMRSAIQNKEEPKPPEDPMILIKLSEYLDLKAKAKAPKAGARKGKG